jgi:hypothetical protein
VAHQAVRTAHRQRLMATGSAAALQPFALQLAGHLNKDGQPTTFLDSQGRLHKQLRLDDRGDREAAFYACAELARQQPPAEHSFEVAGATESGQCTCDATSLLRNGAQATAGAMALRPLLPYIPRSRAP